VSTYAFPLHKCGLYLTHNEHRDSYTSAQDFIQQRELADCFESPEQMRRAIETDSIWVLQWYPETPVGCQIVAAPSLFDVMRLANKAE
jgi:hypothetical protein